MAGESLAAGRPDPERAGRQKLADFAVEWWETLVEPSKDKDNTIPNYEGALERDVLPYLGHLRLDQITIEVIQRWMVDVQTAVQQGRGRYPQRNVTGKWTVIRALGVLSGILGLAEDWDLIRRNPVRHVRNKPDQRPDHAAVVTAPIKVEAIRRELLVVRRRPLRDAVLVSTFAYTEMRPEELRALLWAQMLERTLLIDAAIAKTERKRTKNKRHRSIDLLAHLAQDLRECRMASGRPPDDAPVLPGRDGGPWSQSGYDAWVRHHYKPAAAAVGVDGTPYDLRHSFCSLLFASGKQPAYVAEQMGDRAETVQGTYQHVLKDLVDAPRLLSPDEQIAHARAEIFGSRRPASTPLQS